MSDLLAGGLRVLAPSYYASIVSMLRTGPLRWILVVSASTLFVLALPAAIVLTNVRVMFFDPGVYDRGYQREGVARTTGMSRDELSQATQQIQQFFRGGPPVSLVVAKEWGREPLFNAREQQHMDDVRALLNLVWQVQMGSLAVLVLSGLIVLVVLGPVGGWLLARAAMMGATLTLALFAVMGALTFFDFSSLWTRFHMISFSNDLWLLDPRTDYLIRLFPFGFWLSSVIDLSIRSVIVAGGLLIGALLTLRGWARGARIEHAAG